MITIIDSPLSSSPDKDGGSTPSRRKISKVDKPFCRISVQTFTREIYFVDD